MWLIGLECLTGEEENELFHTPVVERVIELVLIDISRLWHSQTPHD